ncbi:hypothetical protein [Nocardioides sp.]|jgi:FtsH-binding integral membrane protein|uniref:hypothetical protein n=1 Tax=Nocardioides sp. TaxID=35761 RepID=UPI0031FE5D54|nr:hypothetical protein [Nocardioides sp.]
MTTPSAHDAKARLHQVLGLAALSDIVAGIVMAFLGLAQDNQILTVVGVALAAGGLGVMTWVIVQRGKPIQL